MIFRHGTCLIVSHITILLLSESSDQFLNTKKNAFNKHEVQQFRNKYTPHENSLIIDVPRSTTGRATVILTGFESQ